MTSIVNIFQECLNSNLNCKEIYDKISKFSIYELNKYIKEKDVYNEFIKYFQLNFNDEFLYYLTKKKILNLLIQLYLNYVIK